MLRALLYLAMVLELPNVLREGIALNLTMYLGLYTTGAGNSGGSNSGANNGSGSASGSSSRIDDDIEKRDVTEALNEVTQDGRADVYISKLQIFQTFQSPVEESSGSHILKSTQLCGDLINTRGYQGS